ncbi:MAG: hypothetical protein LAQ69_21120 [Acidobacteriia bacterium]|nr:hypothetical protein [Terriglobia bacterium]
MTLVLLVLALLPAGYVIGQAIFWPFEATEEGYGPPDMSAATFNCPGGQPDPTWSTGSPCTPGSRVHIRGAKFPYFVTATDARITGVAYVTMNGNFDGWIPQLMSPGSGQMWGALQLVVGVKNQDGTFTATGGVWEGSWTGTRTVTRTNDGKYVVQSSISNVAFGTVGRITGLKAMWDTTLDPQSGLGVDRGRILDPGGK